MTVNIYEDVDIPFEDRKNYETQALPEVSNYELYSARREATYSMSVRQGQQNTLLDIYKSKYDEVSQQLGNPLETEYDSITGYEVPRDALDYVQYLEKNAPEEYAKLQKEESDYYKSLQKKIEDNTDDSWGNWLSGLAGGAVAQAGDLENLSAYAAGGAVKEGLGYLANALLIGGQETAIQYGLEVKDKPGEVRARRLAEENVTDEQAGKESLTSVAYAAGVGAVAGLLGRFLAGTPEQALHDVARQAPEGVRPEVYANDFIRKTDEIQKAEPVNVPSPTRDIPEEQMSIEAFQDNTIRDAINNLKNNDIVQDLTDADGNVLAQRSTKEVLEDAESDINILQTISDCLMRGSV